MENGFRLYLREHDNKLGGKEVKVRLVDEDADPEIGISAGQELAQDESVTAVVGVVDSAIALGLKDTFNKARKPLIIAGAGADAITGKAASEFVWSTTFANSEVSAAMGRHLAAAARGGGVFLIGPDSAAGMELLGGFQETFTTSGGTIAGQQLTPSGKTTNFQASLAAIQSSDAQAVFAFYAGAEAVAFVTQYQELGLAGEVPLYASGFLTEGSVLEAQGEAATGIQTSLHYSSELDTPGNRTFVGGYSAAYGSSPTIFSVAAYDAAAVLDKALVKGTSGDQIISGLRTVDKVDSPRGPWSFSATHGPFQTYYLRTVTMKDGELVNAVDRELTTP